MGSPSPLAPGSCVVSNRISHVTFCGALRSRTGRGNMLPTGLRVSPHDHREGPCARNEQD